MDNRLTPDLLAFEADHAWIDRNREMLLERYADQWVAVKDGRVIASAPDLEALLSQVPDPAHLCVEFVTREHLEMVL